LIADRKLSDIRWLYWPDVVRYFWERCRHLFMAGVWQGNRVDRWMFTKQVLFCKST